MKLITLETSGERLSLRYLTEICEIVMHLMQRDRTPSGGIASLNFSVKRYANKR